MDRVGIRNIAEIAEGDLTFTVTFAPGASGNLATEDAVWMFNEMGYDTGISFQKILAAAKREKQLIEGNYSGHHINIENETPCKF